MTARLRTSLTVTAILLAGLVSPAFAVPGADQVQVFADGPHVVTYDFGTLPPLTVAYECAGDSVEGTNGTTTLTFEGSATSDSEQVLYTEITCTVYHSRTMVASATGSAQAPHAHVAATVVAIGRLAPWVCASGKLYYNDEDAQLVRILTFGDPFYC